MARLTRPTEYKIEDSNIALLGSDLEKRVREHAGDTEPAWDGAGSQVGLEIWGIEQFKVKPWPKKQHGFFYDGDSYIILRTYKKNEDTDALAYDLHFWLGEHTTQDEAGTAAYKTVELDDHLGGVPVQYREVQGFESARFLSYFPRFNTRAGGVATGFRHVPSEDPSDKSSIRRLFRISSAETGGKSSVVVREVPFAASSLVAGDVYVLDRGTEIWQLNTRKSLGKEKFQAAELVRELDEQGGEGVKVEIFEEGGANKFLAEFGPGAKLLPEEANATSGGPILFRLSDKSGSVDFSRVDPPTRSSLQSSDAFLLDDSANSANPAIYAWIGKHASPTEKRLAVQYAQQYLYDKQEDRKNVRTSIVKMGEGYESEEFLRAIGE